MKSSLERGHRTILRRELPLAEQELERDPCRRERVAQLVGDEREVLVCLPDELGVPLVSVLGDGIRDPGDDATEDDRQLAKGDLCAGSPRRRDDRFLQGPILSDDRVEAEAEAKPLSTMPCGAAAG